MNASVSSLSIHSYAASAGDTIVAVATAPGRGGVGIVRLSGPDALAILTRLFKPQAPAFTGFIPRFLHYGTVLSPDDGTPLDQGLAVFMPGPRSFTGEDVAELQCHGSPVVLAEVVSAAVRAGARHAGRGEFSYRAFMNARMDLTQAEAVAELVAASGPAAARLAHSRLGGEIGRRVEELRERLLDVRAHLCVAVDFPDDEVECLPPDRFLAEVTGAERAIEALLAAFERTNIWQNEHSVVLAGRVNAGKSSLLNALTGRRRALVSDVPGTTRDWLEERVNLDGLIVRLVDTAGLRDTGDMIEMQGIEHGRERMDEADAVLLVTDAANGLSGADHELLAKLGAARQPVIVVLNKTDTLPQPPTPPASLHCVAVSAKTGLGLDELAAEIRHILLHGRHSHGEEHAENANSDALTPNARQADALRRALDDLRQLTDALTAQVPYDAAAVHLDAAVAALAEVAGRAAPDDVLDRVFSEFCIGK